MDVKGKQKNSSGVDLNSPSKNNSKAVLNGPRRISITQNSESRRASRLVPKVQETPKNDPQYPERKKSINSELVEEIRNFRPSTSNYENLQSRGAINTRDDAKKLAKDASKFHPILEIEKMLEHTTPKDQFSNMNVYRDTIQRVENLKKQNEKLSPARKPTLPKPFAGVAGAYLPSVGHGRKKTFRINNNKIIGLNKSALNLDESYIKRTNKSRNESRPEISIHNLSVDAIFESSSYPDSRPYSSLLKPESELGGGPLLESPESQARQSITKPSSQPVISFDAKYFSSNPKETVSLTSSINFVCSILKSSSCQTIEEPKRTPSNAEQNKIKVNKSKNNFNNITTAEGTIKSGEETFVPYSVQEVANLNGYSKILLDAEKRFENLHPSLFGVGRPGTRSSSVQRGKRSTLAPDGKFKPREEAGVEIKLYNWPIPSVIPPEKKYEVERGLKFTKKNELQAAWDKFMKKKVMTQRNEDPKEESFDYKLEPSGKIRVKNLAFTPNISNITALNARKAKAEAKDKFINRRELKTANPSETRQSYYKSKDKIFL